MITRLLTLGLIALIGAGRVQAQALDPEGLCETRAAAVLDALDKEDYATASVDFDAKMKDALPPAKLAAEWKSLVPQYGKLTARGQAHGAESEGYMAVTVPLIFEQATLAAQVACDTTGAVAGFHVVPLPAKAQF